MADLITLGASEYALVSAILAGIWNLSGARDGQTGNRSRYVLVLYLASIRRSVWHDPGLTGTAQRARLSLKMKAPNSLIL